jgi:hypothetical protein
LCECLRATAPFRASAPSHAPHYLLPRRPALTRSSYDWGVKLADGTYSNQVKALRVVEALKSKGLRVFFDYEAMLVHAKADARGGMNSAMASNIQSAAAVVVCFTETYEESKNCMRELTHADNNDKYIFCQWTSADPRSPFLGGPAPSHPLLASHRTPFPRAQTSTA